MDFTGGDISASDFDENYSGILLPPDVFANNPDESVGIVFSSYSSSQIYPLINKTLETFDVASSIVSATLIGNASEFNASVYVVLKLQVEVNLSILL